MPDTDVGARNATVNKMMTKVLLLESSHSHWVGLGWEIGNKWSADYKSNKKRGCEILRLKTKTLDRMSRERLPGE